MQSNICLGTVTICWSLEVILLMNIPDTISSFGVVALTNLLGALLLALFLFPKLKIKLPRNALVKILVLALLNTSYNTMLNIALRYFNATTGAFTLSMTIVVVPIVLFTRRESVEKKTWVGTGLILAGILIGLGGDLLTVAPIGIALLLGACVLRAVYIVVLNDLVKVAEPGKVSIVMLFFVAAISGILWCATDFQNVIAFNIDASGFAGIFIYALVICSLCNALNLYAQKTASAQQATIIYSLEIVFSVLFAAFLPSVLVDTVQLAPNTVLGSLFVCLGNVFANLDYDALRARHRAKKIGVGDATAETAEAAAAGNDTAVPQERASASQTKARRAISFGNPSAPRIQRVFPFLTMRDAGITLLLLLLYMVLATPVLTIVYDEQLPATLRLAPMLVPALAAFFGWRGAWVMGVGNLLLDLANHDFGIWSPFTALGNALYVVILAAFLAWIIDRGGYASRVKGVFAFLGGSLVASLVGATLIAVVVALTQPAVTPIALSFFEVVFVSNIFVSVMPGLALAVLLSTEFGFEPYYLFGRKKAARLAAERGEK